MIRSAELLKNGKSKTNSLNNTVQDLTTKFGNIINELTDLMNKKLPDMNAKTDCSSSESKRVKS
ncbi:hypothetical protein [Lactobacillus gasseri]|uniref:hypothetical protein n=1 Tax=Lactobacillus gasseri TaxID=1596 RepID=UPI0015872FE9|nr:hypothetical protein [Lactobacillus gasseri]